VLEGKQQPAYYFYYSLLGNDITNGAFYSLAHPNFRPERASIRIKGDKFTLNTFMAGLADLKVGRGGSVINMFVITFLTGTFVCW